MLIRAGKRYAAQQKLGGVFFSYGSDQIMRIGNISQANKMPGSDSSLRAACFVFSFRQVGRSRPGTPWGPSPRRTALLGLLASCESRLPGWPKNARKHRRQTGG